MKIFDIITIFPETIEPYAKTSILGRAGKNKLIKIEAYNLRDWADDKHKSVDDTPYGGGPGMVMKVEPFDQAVRSIKKRLKKTRIILTSASGKKFTQKDAKRLSKYDQLIFLCGRYEGVDARVEEKIADESFSVGEYVLTGGELPALIMTDAIARQIPGVLGSKESLATESYDSDLLEYPQYTKPEVYKRWKVPEILLSGDHQKIAEWREKQQKTV